MPKILLQQEIPQETLQPLAREFPQYTFVASSSCSDAWSGVEILFGDHLSAQELGQAGQLKWVHTPSGMIQDLPLPLLERRNIILTTGEDYEMAQATEYTTGAILGFAKSFFDWKKPFVTLEDWAYSALMKNLWTLSHKTFLQIGVGALGTEILKSLSNFGMTTWAIKPHHSFHPYAKKTFSPHELHTLLPHADVICLCPSSTQSESLSLGKKELDLMKSDSILVCLGPKMDIDFEALRKELENKKFRGVVLDLSNYPFELSTLANPYSQLLVTPLISRLPYTKQQPAFLLFIRNLRTYLTGKYLEMKNAYLF